MNIQKKAKGRTAGIIVSACLLYMASAGFVNSLRSSFVMLVYAEMYGTGQGMWYFVKKYAELGILSNTWFGFVYMVIVLVIVMQIFEKVKKRIFKWTID